MRLVIPCVLAFICLAYGSDLLRHMLILRCFCRKSARSGFTLLEIMIVVTIIGLLAAIAVPSFHKVRNRSLASRFANDFRIFAATFEVCALEQGSWPEDGQDNDLPEEVQPYFEGSSWYQSAANGGYWDWELDRWGYVASVALTEGHGGLSDEVYSRVDDILDDGNLATGRFIQVSDRYLYVLEQN